MLDELFQSPAVYFAVPALIGTAIFLLRLGLLFIGGHHGLDVDPSVPDLHGVDTHSDIHEGSSIFKAITFQAVAAFMMGFGWAGLGALKGAGLSPSMSVLVGLVGGVVLAAVLTMLLRSVARLESSGNISVASAVGAEGSVYATVPAKGEGRGQVTVIVSGRQRTYNATSDGPAVATASRVKVIRVNDDHSLVVTPV